MGRPYSMASMAHSPLEPQAPSLAGHRASASDAPPGSHGSGVSSQLGNKQAARPPEDGAAPQPPEILGELPDCVAGCAAAGAVVRRPRLALSRAAWWVCTAGEAVQLGMAHWQQQRLGT